MIKVGSEEGFRVNKGNLIIQNVKRSSAGEMNIIPDYRLKCSECLNLTLIRKTSGECVKRETSSQVRSLTSLC